MSLISGTGNLTDHHVAFYVEIVLIGRLVSLNNSDFKVYLDDSCFRIDPKYADNLEMRNGANPYPTLPMMEKPQAPAYIETP